MAILDELDSVTLAVTLAVTSAVFFFECSPHLLVILFLKQLSDLRHAEPPLYLLCLVHSYHLVAEYKYPRQYEP